MPTKPPTFTSKTQRKTKASKQQAASARGDATYHGEWRRLRRQHLQNHPLCVLCRDADRIVAATVVDRRVPVQGDPPHRLYATSFRSMCASHYAQLSRNFQPTGRNELPNRCSSEQLVT